MADKVIIEAEVKSNVGEVSKDASNAASEFKIMGVSLNGVKKAFAGAAVTAKGMFGTIKAGLISTGIGAFVVLIGSLVSYFTNTKRGADKLATAFAGIGAAVDVVTDRISRVGEIIALVFEGKFREAGKLAKEIFSGMTEEIENETAAMMALKKRTQELRDADNEFMIQKAATRQEIERARLVAEDETKSAKERLDNLKKALELEAETTKQELVLAKERMEIQQQEMLLSENSAEDEAELARLKVALIETETASIKMRRRVVTEVNALEREIQAEEKARAKEKQDIIDAEAKQLKEAADAALKIAKEKADKELKLAKEKADKEKMLAEKLANDKIALDKLVEQEKDKTISMGFEAAKTLGGKNDAIQKSLAVAQTIYNTQQAIMKAMATVPPPWNMVQAGLTGVMGATAIQKILSTSPESASGGGSIPTASAQTPAPQMMQGAFELGGAEAPEPARAYVVSDDITNNQNKLAIIRRRATI